MHHKGTLDLPSRPLVLDQTLLRLLHDGIDRRGSIEIDEAESAIGIEGDAENTVSVGDPVGFEEGSDFGFFRGIGNVSDEEGGFGRALVG